LERKKKRKMTIKESKKLKNFIGALYIKFGEYNKKDE
jgi:hypothetical protein